MQARRQATRPGLTLGEFDLQNFIPAITPRWKPPAHLKPLTDVFERIKRGEAVRVLLSVPPQHGKTETELHGLAQLLLRFPERSNAFVAYGAPLALSKSALARDYALRAGVHIRRDSNAKGEWLTTAGGGLRATGVGGPLTGQPVSGLLIVDDPHKNREAAESLVDREKVFNWFTSTAMTRVHMTTSVLVVHCLVGDTRVLMADGTEKALKSLRVGDAVATYANGILTTSKILNWANQGPDCVLAIKTSSGAVVRANERHPFLVQRNGGTEWVRVRDLRVGDTLLRAVPSGGSGAALSAPPTDAASPSAAKGIAPRTTTRRGGQLACGPRPPMQRRVAPRTSSTATESPRQITTRSCGSNEGSAPCASSRPAAATSPISGAQGSPSITTTHPVAFADSSATTATSRSVTGRPRTSSSAPLDTFALVHDPIVSIDPDGSEDVFDIQVEGTENFVANGVVSHNTRWHEDDLIGRLSKEVNAKGEKVWEVINLPAVSETGAPLWPEERPIELLDAAKHRSEYDWWSMYMGSPRPKGGALFGDVHFFTKMPTTSFRVAIGVDLAYSAKTHSDCSVAVVMAESGGVFYVIDVIRMQVLAPEFGAALKALALRYPGAPMLAYVAGVEKGSVDFMRVDGVPLKSRAATSDKFIRAQPVVAAWGRGLVQLPANRGALWLPGTPKLPQAMRGLPVEWVGPYVSELKGFTGIKDKRDDQVDATAPAYDQLQRRAAATTGGALIITADADSMAIG